MNHAIQQLRKHPEWASGVIAHSVYGTLRVRPLAREDAEAFGRFLEGLSVRTRMLFGPHPLNAEEACKLCNAVDESQIIRLVLETPENEIIGYFILFPTVRPGETKRYAEVGIRLSGETDCTFAPCLADAYQGKGLARAAMDHIVALARKLGFSRMVLSGGTQAINIAGRAFYTKVGFETVREFVSNHPTRGRIDNLDMMLHLTEAR
jgi:diamine N-acetyltransferase